MKKVLALVLAVIMVCTMAFAVTVDGIITPGGSTPATTPSDSYDIVAPGTTYLVDFTGAKFYQDKDGKFVPANNKVTVTVTGGSDLIASQGWVKVLEGGDQKTRLMGSGDTYSYEYRITLKSDFTRIADGKTPDFSISSITLKATGYNTQELFKENVAAGKLIKADVGYVAQNVILNNGTGAADGKINVITKLTKDAKEVNTFDVAVGVETNTTKATVTLTKGDKLFYNPAVLVEFSGSDLCTDGTAYTGSAVYTASNPWNKAGVAYYAQTGTGLEVKAYNVYAKAVDGSVYQVSATLDDGVLKFAVPALSNVIVTEQTLKTVGTIGTTTGSTTGTTTNPGTGANDVVGVAAALAVVALVSGAAISLKK